MLKIFKILVSIIIGFSVLIGFALFFLFKQTGPSQCYFGHLETMESCEKDHSTFSWMNSGQWYTKAEGVVAKDFCQKFVLGKLNFPESLSISENGKIMELLTIPCGAYFSAGDVRFDKCFASSRLSSNYNTRYFWLVVLDHSCQRGLYFRASGKALLEGKIVDAFSPDKVIAVYPEIKLNENTPLQGEKLGTPFKMKADIKNKVQGNLKPQ